MDGRFVNLVYHGDIRQCHHEDTRLVAVNAPAVGEDSAGPDVPLGDRVEPKLLDVREHWRVSGITSAIRRIAV